MTDRQKEITSFLQYAYKFKSAYPNEINEDYIYSFLQAYDVNNEDVKKPYDPGYFTYFTEYYKNNKVLDVYYDSSQESFLQVQHFTSNQRSDYDFIKLYVNVSNKGYFNSVSSLLNFLSMHPEIEHLSKISKECRCDQIILRVRDMDGIVKIINHIGSDPNILNNLKNSNPFLMKFGAVGLAFDNLLSYNGLIAHFINEYLTTKKSVEEINADDFAGYLMNIYNDLISEEINETYMNYISSDLMAHHLKHLKDIGVRATTSDVLLNHSYILNQFINLYNNEDLNRFNALYEQSRNQEYSKNVIDFFDKKYKLYREVGSTLYYKKILDDYIIFASFKYQNVHEVANRISEFAKGRVNDPDTAIKNITRDKGFRDKFRNISPEIIYNITNSDIFGYVYTLTNSLNLNDYENSSRVS